MIAILTVPEKDLSFEFDNLTIQSFQKMVERSHETFPISLFEPSGKPITLITSNMPEPLRDIVIDLIEKYCNHK